MTNPFIYDKLFIRAAVMQKVIKENIMNKMFRNRTQQPISERQLLENKYLAARSNLLLVLLFTVINVVLLITQSNTYFLFSASIPYMLVDLGMFLCGLYPEELYTGELAGMEFLPSTVFTVMLIMAIAMLALYFIAWLLSKKQKVGWLIFALVLFSIDTVGMFVYFGISLSMILDIVFHGWIIGILAVGISAHYKLKNLPEEEFAFESVNEEGMQNSGEFEIDTEKPDSPILRPADLSVKSKTLLEFEAFGHRIIYRRVKKTNELVIDGNVYDEYIALFERAHMLTATLGGHEYAVGFDGISSSYANVDGQIAAQKMRII